MKASIFKVALWMTGDCNLKCKYCYEGEDKILTYMDEHIAEKALSYIISQMDKLQISDCLLHFHGGEPLLAFEGIKHVMEFIKHQKISDKDFHYSITTNGTIMGEDIKKYLLDNFHTISISIDGCSKAHDSNRIFCNGKGTHSIALKNGIELAKYKNVRVRMTITPDNVGMFFENIVFLVESGFKTIVPIIDNFSSLWSKDLMSILQDELVKTSKYLKEVREKEVVVYKVNKDDTSYKGACYGGITNINIDPYGNIYPCTYIVGKREFICGTIFEGTYPEKIKEIQELNRQVVSGCIGCNYYEFCPTSSCKLINKCITGDYLCASPVICATENVKFSFRRLIIN